MTAAKLVVVMASFELESSNAMMATKLKPMPVVMIARLPAAAMVSSSQVLKPATMATKMIPMPVAMTAPLPAAMALRTRVEAATMATPARQTAVSMTVPKHGVVMASSVRGEQCDDGNQPKPTPVAMIAPLPDVAMV